MSYFNTGSKDPQSERCEEQRQRSLSEYAPITSFSYAIPNARLFTRVNFPGDTLLGAVLSYFGALTTNIIAYRH